MRLIAAFTFFITAGAVAAAQEPLRFRSDSADLVVLSASVIDPDGGFVRNVDPERFAVYEDGKRQKIALFSNGDAPVSLGLIIDNSASMRPKMAEVLASTIELARTSNPDDELFALAFNDDVKVALGARRALMTEDLAALEAAVSSLKPEGRTSLYDAIMAGLDRLDTSVRARKVLIVLSDGGDNASKATLDDVMQRAQRSAATIYTIGLFDESDRDRNPGVLAALARASGGERYLPASVGPLMQACRRIADDIRSAYTIAFEPGARDGRYHKIDVQVGRASGRKLEVRARTGYVAPGSVTP